MASGRHRMYRYSEVDRHTLDILVMERHSGVASVRFYSDNDETLILGRFDEYQDRLPPRLDGLVDFGLNLGRGSDACMIGTNFSDDVSGFDSPLGGGAAVFDLDHDHALDFVGKFEPLAQLGGRQRKKETERRNAQGPFGPGLGRDRLRLVIGPPESPRLIEASV